MAIGGGDELREDEKAVTTVSSHLIRIEHARIVPFGRLGSLRDVDLTVLGSTVRHPIDHVEVFPAPANVTSVRFINDELTSMCPVTQQPDLSSVVIEYVPAEWCVESKSLKLYLWGFRDRAVFAEALAAEIAGEIMTTAQPTRVTGSSRFPTPVRSSRGERSPTRVRRHCRTGNSASETSNCSDAASVLPRSPTFSCRRGRERDEQRGFRPLRVADETVGHHTASSHQSLYLSSRPRTVRA